MIDLNFKYEKLLKYLLQEAPFTPETAIILGSGLGRFAESVESIKTIFSYDIPSYPSSTVEGHPGKIHFAKHKSKNILLFEGRLHLYEGYKLDECILPVLISKKLGCKNLILTNAAGGINSSLVPGDLMLAISFNALNIKKELTGLIGITSIKTKDFFLNCPSKKINEIIKSASVQSNIELKEGVYWYTKGPSYETPAEIKMIKKFGGDAVGMSTVHEAIFAAVSGIEVSIISCITNFASGISNMKLNHREVTETANSVKEKFERLVKKSITLL
jgi:purine-nucleoside phosphorylase